MTNKINERLGLKPATRTRRATHGRLLASAQICPQCGGRHVIRAQSEHATGEFMCAGCSTFFDPEEKGETG